MAGVCTPEYLDLEYRCLWTSKFITADCSSQSPKIVFLVSG